MTFLKYLHRLIRTWGALAFAISEVIAFIASSISAAIEIPSWVFWSIAVMAFVAANYQIFLENEQKKRALQRLIDEMEGPEASLIVKIVESAFIHSAPVLVLGGRFADGLMPDGLPVEAIASAELEVHNLGEEEGELDWQLDLEESDLPKIFSIASDTYGELVNLPTQVPGRKRVRTTWRISCWMHEKNSFRFADGLLEAQSYKFVIRYRTLRVGEPTSYRTVAIEGDFDHYRSEINKRWRESSHNELVHTDS